MSDAGLVRNMRMIKSSAVVDTISQAATIAGRAFARINEVASEGTPLSKVFRDFQRLCLDEGADGFSYWRVHLSRMAMRMLSYQPKMSH